MPETYTRQSAFSNGDVIDAPLFNAEFDQLVLAFDATTGHTHDGTAAGGAPVPLIQKGTSGVYVDTTNPAAHKITFKIAGVTVSEVTAGAFTDTTGVTHTPDGGVVGPLNTYLDGLEIAVGDAASDAASASISAVRAESAAMTLGIPVYVADAGSYTIVNTAENADVVFEGNGTLTLPTVLVKGRRFTIRCSSKVADKLVTVLNPNFSILGNKLVVTAGDDLTLSSKQLVTLEAISTTELEIV
tara:strand:+ start:877 stop:1605 length:729 start_codon:yes stop_codon:yes gene_type:complete